LIVIVILGILAAVVVLSVGGITDRGEASTCVMDERTLATAIEAYMGKYVATSIPPTGAGTDRYEVTLSEAGFIREVSINWDVSGDGSLTPQLGSAC
jgi:type II secretory pathway pseudopilin PulG